MLTKRVMPCLLFLDDGLVKTVKFKNPQYVGDPVNAIKIYNEKEVDELIFLDITATNEERAPRYDIIEKISSECFMPLCYGGGISTIDQIRKIFYLGAEKVAIGTSAFTKPELIKEASEIFGSQSIVVVVDVKKNFFKKYETWINSGTKNTQKDALEYALQMQELGAGELLINNIDRDGTYSGYDIALLQRISSVLTIPVIALGGAGTLMDIDKAFKEGGVSACALGSMAVYQGQGLGVLINFPLRKDLLEIIG